MKKLLQVAASAALLGGVLLTVPATARAATLKYDMYVSHTGTVISGYGVGCQKPGYDNLQDALDDAWNGAKIYICPGDWYPTAEAEGYRDGWYNDNDVELVGAGATRTYLNGDCTGDSMIYSEGYNVTVRNITLRNGCSTDDYYYDAGSIYADYGADVYCYNSVFDGNVASDVAGAVLADYVYLNGCTFTNNYAYSNDSYQAGGAIYANYVESVKSKFVNNHGDGAGGAIFAWDGMQASASTFDSNDSDSDGGAVYAEDDSYFTGSKFSGNEANYAGGAISGAWASMTVKGGTFTGNYANCFGGAISAYGMESVYTDNVGFIGNYISGDCGVGDAISSFYVNLKRGSFKGNYGSHLAVYACIIDWTKVRWNGDQYADGC